MSTCWLYLIRHGATANNRQRPPRLQGRRTDPELSPEGIDQAEATGKLLAEMALDAVYTSPLSRARQTAEAIALPHDLPLRIADALIEVDVGQWEGLAWDVIQRRDPEAYRLFMADASKNAYLGGENLTVVQQRVLPAFAKLLADNPDRRIAVVAHNVVNRCWLAHLLGMPLAAYRSIPQDNCGVNLIRHRRGESKLVTVNAAWHLPDIG